jgi:hypothetical protein
VPLHLDALHHQAAPHQEEVIRIGFVNHYGPLLCVVLLVIGAIVGYVHDRRRRRYW